MDDIEADNPLTLSYTSQKLTISNFKEFEASEISIYLFLTNSGSSGPTTPLKIKTYLSDGTTMIDEDETEAYVEIENLSGS